MRPSRIALVENVIAVMRRLQRVPLERQGRGREHPVRREQHRTGGNVHDVLQPVGDGRRIGTVREQTPLQGLLAVPVEDRIDSLDLFHIRVEILFRELGVGRLRHVVVTFGEQIRISVPQGELVHVTVEIVHQTVPCGFQVAVVSGVRRRRPIENAEIDETGVGGVPQGETVLPAEHVTVIDDADLIALAVGQSAAKPVKVLAEHADVDVVVPRNAASPGPARQQRAPAQPVPYAVLPAYPV